MSCLKTSLLAAVVTVALLGSAPREARAVGGEFSYQTFVMGTKAFECVSNAVNNSRSITYYGYQGVELCYYAYLYSYYGYTTGNSGYAYFTEGKCYWAYQACGAEYTYFGGNAWWYYAAAYSYYQYIYCYYTYTYE